MTLELHPETDALLVVDVQPDFMPGGALPVPEGDQIVRGIAELVHRFRTVVATQDWHPEGHVSFAAWPRHCVQGTPGAALHAGLPLDGLTLILRKGTRPDV